MIFVCLKITCLTVSPGVILQVPNKSLTEMAYLKSVYITKYVKKKHRFLACL